MDDGKLFLSNDDVMRLANIVLLRIHAFLGRNDPNFKDRTYISIYGIPRGGIPPSYAVKAESERQIGTKKILLTDDPSQADAFVDDIVDSGSTQEAWQSKYDTPFFALVDKQNPASEAFGRWVVFPWEGDASSGIEDNIRRILQFCGEDPSREGLLETPKRVAKALSFWTQGYSQDPVEILKTFEDGAENCDEMVIVRDIPFYSKCEHHMADIFGTASIAYIPDGRIVGLSKLNRLLDVFARRLQVQERLTNQIADALTSALEPKGVGVVIRARHMCMESRGVCQQGHHTITSALRGVLKTDPAARAEFMSLVK